MKNKNKILVLTLSAFLLSAYASAYAIDGNLNDWGVTPFTDWDPDAGTVDWTVEDNYEVANGQPWGGEPYDIEAIYFDDDSHNAYFAIVTSMGPQGYLGCVPGDLALDLDDNVGTGQDGYEYGIVLTNHDGFVQGQICHNPTWSDPTSFPANGPVRITSCTGTGTATVKYENANIQDNHVDNWVIEIAAPKTALGTPTYHQISNLHATISCGNDVIELIEYQWDFSVPEFVSGFVAFLIVLVTPGFAYLISRK